MWWKMVPEMRAHVLTQFAFTWLTLYGMYLIYVHQPELVTLVNNALLGAGFVETSFSERVLADYYSYGWYTAGFSLAALEIGGVVLVWNFRARPDEYPRFQELLHELAVKAGVRTPKLIVMRKMPEFMSKTGILNAAATQSVLTGNKVVIMGPIIETLTEEEMRYVAAHEIAHLADWDIVAAFFVGVGNGALGWLTWIVFSTLVYGAFSNGWHEAVFLLSTWVVLEVTHFAYKLLAAWHTRTREYMADAGAVKYEGWENRVALITGLARIAHAMTGWRPIKIFRPDRNLFKLDWLLHTHPDIDDRARALQLNPEILPDGNVRVGGVVVSDTEVLSPA